MVSLGNKPRTSDSKKSVLPTAPWYHLFFCWPSSSVLFPKEMAKSVKQDNDIHFWMPLCQQPWRLGWNVSECMKPGKQSSVPSSSEDTSCPCGHWGTRRAKLPALLRHQGTVPMLRWSASPPVSARRDFHPVWAWASVSPPVRWGRCPPSSLQL